MSALAETQAWLERAVIGLNLCPFAKAVHSKGQIRTVLSEARTPDELVADLEREMRRLAETSAEEIDTTLIVHPYVLQDFLDFNDFLDIADALLEALELDGVLQVASFHPDYQFEGTEPFDMSNATNQSPYPTLHLLREDSVERAVLAFPEADAIFDKNIVTLEALGAPAWEALRAACRADAQRNANATSIKDSP